MYAETKTDVLQILDAARDQTHLLSDLNGIVAEYALLPPVRWLEPQTSDGMINVAGNRHAEAKISQDGKCAAINDAVATTNFDVAVADPLHKTARNWQVKLEAPCDQAGILLNSETRLITGGGLFMCSCSTRATLQSTSPVDATRERPVYVRFQADLENNRVACWINNIPMTVPLALSSGLVDARPIAFVCDRGTSVSLV